MQENETNVAKTGTSPEPAKTAENSTAAVAPGVPAGAAGELAKETPVSYPDHRHDVAQIDALEARVIAIVRDFLLVNPPTIGIKQMEDLGDHFDRKLAAEIKDFKDGAVALAKEYTDGAIENAKADMLKHLAGLGASSAAAAAATEPSAVKPHELAVGDPVEVWVDKKANTFRLGKIAGIHDGAHAFDVELDDGTVTKVPADGLQFDDRR